WLYAVVGYRFHGDSIATGSVPGRAHQLWLSLPPAGKALGVLALLAAAGWRSSPLLARIWLGAAVLGVLGGGNFHPHYYLQLVPRGRTTALLRRNYRRVARIGGASVYRSKSRRTRARGS